jgi:hypothetical protein
MQAACTARLGAVPAACCALGGGPAPAARVAVSEESCAAAALVCTLASVGPSLARGVHSPAGSLPVSTPVYLQNHN